jgi:S-DNA-T family DNA segregation ATPase FtsK/SpoIIIE
MARLAQRSNRELLLLALKAGWQHPLAERFRGGLVAAMGLGLVLTLASYEATDPSFNADAAGQARNWLGGFGAGLADILMQSLGLGAWVLAFLVLSLGLSRATSGEPSDNRTSLRLRALAGVAGIVVLAGALQAAPTPQTWPLARGLGGFWGEAILGQVTAVLSLIRLPAAGPIAVCILSLASLAALGYGLGLSRSGLLGLIGQLGAGKAPAQPVPRPRRAARPAMPMQTEQAEAQDPDAAELEPAAQVLNIKPPKSSRREIVENQGAFDFVKPGGFQLPELAMLAKPKPRSAAFDEESLRQNARLLETVLGEFGVKGQIDQIRPGPVVTLYELVPAAGVKHARVVALSDDIARSMSARACRVAVVQGRNAIGIELPNARRETVYLRDLLASSEYEKSSQILPMALGETIGGEPYIADMSKMPHLLIAGTTGSGKSVGVNAMILSILYRLPPDQCKFIMIDPKMLELSVYDGIPHLLAPVVTDPKKAIVALKWTVREMEDRYRRMSKIGVRNIGGFNEKAIEAKTKGEHFVRTVQTGFDDTGKPIYEEERLNPEPMPYLVVVIDEVADLMMVAGKDIEGAVQRLAQMARAAGIHLIMATQRPSVDVITGTIKANFPTRISFQVTSKIDSRTIMGEQGAEQLLGQGDMLYMAGGGRITRLHGPFVSDTEVETVAAYLRAQGQPQYLDDITAGADEEGEDGETGEGGLSGDDLYDRAVAVVTRDRKASTSYIQRRLQIGYNRAASLMEKMEREGVVTAANHAGKRDILAAPPPH